MVRPMSDAANAADATNATIALDGKRLALRRNPPALGADTLELLQSVGYDAATITRLCEEGIVGMPAGFSEEGASTTDPA